MLHLLEKLEAPTWALIVCVWGGWISVTWYSAYLPWWLLLPLGAWCTGWYYSLQHEVIHDHPTKWRWINDLIGYAPIGLFIPYDIYRADHIRHHDKATLTIPGQDPESFYFDKATWAAMPPLLKGLNIVNNMLIGRLTVGVAIIVIRFWWAELRLVLHGDGFRMLAWLKHAVLVAAVLYWVIAVCGIPLWLYIVCFAYPGLALTLLRSYTEHRAASDPDHRTAIVESPGLMSLLYLNNNLHAAHHHQPSLPWYRLPALYASNKQRYLQETNGFFFQGYSDVIRKYLFAPIDAPVLPDQPKS